MAKVTSKLQITIPKHASFSHLTREERLQLFREGTERQAKRNAEWTGERNPKDRGWTREDVYEDRVRPR
jgi:hypothetical protein